MLKVQLMKTLLGLILCVVSQVSMATNYMVTDFKEYEGALILSITKRDGFSYLCTSVAYSRTKLITAAHCLKDAVSVKAYTDISINDYSVAYDAKKFQNYASYDDKKSLYIHDIAVIALAKPLPPTVPTYKILNLQDDGDEITRAGFGMRDGVNARTVVNNIRVGRIFQDYFEAKDRLSISGDSGGPLFKRHNGKLYLVGIHSTMEYDITYNVMFSPDIEDWVDNY